MWVGAWLYVGGYTVILFVLFGPFFWLLPFAIGLSEALVPCLDCFPGVNWYLVYFLNRYSRVWDWMIHASFNI